jgi:hypothetical protein
MVESLIPPAPRSAMSDDFCVFFKVLKNRKRVKVSIKFYVMIKLKRSSAAFFNPHKYRLYCQGLQFQ